MRTFSISAEIVAPRLVVPDLNTIFGTVATHTSTRRMIVVTNVGNATVRITARIEPLSTNGGAGVLADSSEVSSSDREGSDASDADEDAQRAPTQDPTEAVAQWFDITPSTAEVPPRTSITLALIAHPIANRHQGARVVLESLAGDFFSGDIGCTGGGPMIDVKRVQVCVVVCWDQAKCCCVGGGGATVLERASGCLLLWVVVVAVQDRDLTNGCPPPLLLVHHHVCPSSTRWLSATRACFSTSPLHTAPAVFCRKRFQGLGGVAWSFISPSWAFHASPRRGQATR